MMTSGPGTVPDAGLIQRWQSRGFHITVLVELHDLDRLHGCTDGDFARNCPGVCRAAKRLREFFGDQQASFGDAEQLRVCVIVVLASFDIEKRESRLAVAHGQIERFARGKFFDYELVE